MAKKKKKNNRKKLSSLLLMLFLTAIMLTISTYAWFLANKTVTVSTLNVNVGAKGGIQISADGTTWRTILQNSDLITGYATDENNIPTTMEPVSTGKTVTGGNLNMFLGTVETNANGDIILVSTASPHEGGKYIVFDMFLRADSDTDLYMTTSSSIEAADAENDVGLQNSARVAFVVEGNTGAGSPLTTIQGLNTGTASTTYIWEPNYNVHTAGGIGSARDYFGINNVTATMENAIVTNGIIAPFASTDSVLLNETNPTDHNGFFAAVTTDYKTIPEFTTYQEVFSLTAGITKVKTYVWIEGQDVDCENEASGNNIDINLQFSTNSSANP